MHYQLGYAREEASAAPRRSGRPSKGPARVPEGHFDPNELTRRLYKVLAEQQARAERTQRIRWKAPNPDDFLGPSVTSRHGDGAKPRPDGRQEPTATSATHLTTEPRRANSAKPNPSAHIDHAGPATTQPPPGPYHHVPSEAARQFARTTTAATANINNPHSSGGGGGDLVRKLSRRALEYHHQHHHHQDAKGLSAVAPQAEQSSPLREHTFEHELSRFMPNNGGDRHHHQRQQHQLAGGTSKRASWYARRRSTGNSAVDGFERADDVTATANIRRSLIALEPLMHLAEVDTPPPPPPPPPLVGEELRRVDWTQSDEARNNQPPRPPLLSLSPLLRKADSLLMMRGRRGSRESAEHDKETAESPKLSAKGSSWLLSRHY